MSYSQLDLFNRMIGIVTEEELNILKDKRIAVAGCGGVGFTHAETLVRMGVGGINIADPDTFSVENMNRQFGATMETISKPKVEVLRDRLISINPNLKISLYSKGITDETVAQFLSGVDLVVDAMDYFVMDAPGEDPRQKLHRIARETKLPVIISGPVGFGATLHYFSPDEMSFNDYFTVSSKSSQDQKLVNFGKGMIPGQLYRHYQESPALNFEQRKVASLSCSCLLSSSLIGAAGLMILLGRNCYFKPVPHCYQLDLQAGKFEEICIPGGVDGIDKNARAYIR